MSEIRRGTGPTHQDGAPDRLSVIGMEFFGRHGVWPQENAAGQRFVVDVELALNLAAAGAADSLGNAVDYAVLHAEVRHIVEGPTRRLVEALAESIAQRVLHLWPVPQVQVRVHKPDAPLPGKVADVQVTVTRRRSAPDPGGATRAVNRWPVERRCLYLGLGSNLGDRLGYLASGLRGLMAAGDIQLLGLSSVYETAPWGHVQQEPFYNIVARVETVLSPHEVLARALSVEAACDRVRRQRWGPRTLDIDLLLVGDLTVQEPDLVVPHPHMHERAFVLTPLLELDAGAALPKGQPLAPILAGLPDQGVRRVAPPQALHDLLGAS